MYTPKLITTRERDETVNLDAPHFEVMATEDIKLPKQLKNHSETWKANSYSFIAYKKGKFYYIGFFKVGAIKIHESRVKVV